MRSYNNKTAPRCDSASPAYRFGKGIRSIVQITCSWQSTTPWKDLSLAGVLLLGWVQGAGVFAEDNVPLNSAAPESPQSASLKRDPTVVSRAAAKLASARDVDIPPPPEPVEMPPDRLPEPRLKTSGTAKLEYNTHFVSYGRDVWRAGADWGETGNVNPSLALTFDWDPLTFYLGTWMNFNDSVPSDMRGDLQEVDVWLGVGSRVDRMSFGVTYQQWFYSSQVEEVLDTWLAFDDKGMLADGFGFYPALLLHTRLTGEDLDEGMVLVGRLTPGFALTESNRSPVWLSFPTEVGWVEEGFHGGDGGFGYFSIGPKLSIPLNFLSVGYGNWYADGALTYYHTDKAVIPTNPDEDFVTGSVGLSFHFD
jgi:hypothetical protein